MNRWRRKLLLISTLLSSALSFTTQADTAMDQLAHRIASDMEAYKGYPRDPALYQSQVTYGHNIGPVHTWPVKDFLAATGAEMSAMQHFIVHEKVHVIGMVVGTDTIVITSETTGTLPDQTALYSKTALFASIKEGRISRLELWADPGSIEKLVSYIAKERQSLPPAQR